LPEDETDPEPIAIRKFEADSKLLAAAHRTQHLYQKGKVVEGTIGSADVWNNELDRIHFLPKLWDISRRNGSCLCSTNC
jgi:adenosylhomocysteine nucleosidase